MALTNLHSNWNYGSYYNERDHYIKQKKTSDYWEETQLILRLTMMAASPLATASICWCVAMLKSNKFLADALGITLSDADKSLLAGARAYRAASRTNPPGISSADLKTSLEYIASQLTLNLGSEQNATKLLDTLH